MYNIKFGEHTLRILSDVCSFSFEEIGKNKAVIYNYTKPKKTIEILRDITSSPIKNHVIFHSDTDLVFSEVAKKFTQIQAGGGLVVNEKKQILFIFRNGKWDLPKGKIEANETSELGAIREVEEECGLKISRLDKLLDITYHTYMLDNKYILKSNYWYIMYADSSQILVPQSEENIEKVEWIDRDKVESLLSKSYESISDLIHKYLKSSQ
ncbi:MAG: NUDIX hydrolase [Chitinophagales bacterium]|jgi:ADP-ribose pyrophosphatase YjhB (NUDIX family)|nr:NUDIX domain-containing protein [Sphingobacteriales bacterium]